MRLICQISLTLDRSIPTEPYTEGSQIQDKGGRSSKKGKTQLFDYNINPAECYHYHSATDCCEQLNNNTRAGVQAAQH